MSIPHSYFTRSKRPMPTIGFVVVAALVLPPTASGDVPTGSADVAQRYFASLETKIHFSGGIQIAQTTLDDVATYLGYTGFTGADLQNISPSVLMSPDRLLASCATSRCPDTLQKRDAVLAALGPIPLRPDDILATRFFAPKIMNINLPEATRPLGWRKLVRLRSRDGSPARKNHISAGIILFNFFNAPNERPFSSDSVNTQVMLIVEPDNVAPKGAGLDALYWLDYDALSSPSGGKLSLALNAAFDANEIQASNGKRDYFVPDGCVACHGVNPRRPLVNYLDTDHWFDRLDNDFGGLKSQGIALLFDADTNDSTDVRYKLTFDVIRRFNEEADAEVRLAQPKHDETLASAKWLAIHAADDEHLGVLDRAIGVKRWAGSDDQALLSKLNQYCFRCHGTVKFSVFDKQQVIDRRSDIVSRIDPKAAPNLQMPPDRPLPAADREFLLKSLPRK